MAGLRQRLQRAPWLCSRPGLPAVPRVGLRGVRLPMVRPRLYSGSRPRGWVCSLPPAKSPTYAPLCWRRRLRCGHFQVQQLLSSEQPRELVECARAWRPRALPAVSPAQNQGRLPSAAKGSLAPMSLPRSPVHSVAARRWSRPCWRPACPHWEGTRYWPLDHYPLRRGLVCQWPTWEQEVERPDGPPLPPPSPATRFA